MQKINQLILHGANAGVMQKQKHIKQTKKLTRTHKTETEQEQKLTNPQNKHERKMLQTRKHTKPLNDCKGVPSWDGLQQTPGIQMWIKQIQKMDRWMHFSIAAFFCCICFMCSCFCIILVFAAFGRLQHIYSFAACLLPSATVGSPIFSWIFLDFLHFKSEGVRIMFSKLH